MPTQGLEHIIFVNTGTAKAASTFNLNIDAISKHIAKRLKFDGLLAALAMRELKAPTINFPNDLTDPTNLVKTKKWQRNFNHAHDQQKWWDKNTQKIYNVVMQHSMPEMKTKLLTMNSWAKTSAAQDGIALLKTIRDIWHKKDGNANATTILDLVQMDKDMFLVHQAPTKPLSSYLSKFKGAVNVVESSDGSPWFHPAATKIVYDKIYSSSNYKTDKNSNLTDYQAAAANRLRGNTLPCSSSTTSATKPTGTSRKKSTTTPSRDPTWSPAPTTKSSSSRTSINPHNSNTNPAAANEGAALPSRRKARPLRRQQQIRQRH